MSEENIVLMARLKVKSDKIEEARKAALAIVDDSRSEAGCLNYDIHQSIEDPTVFLWHETWTNQAALDEHFQKPYFAAFFAIVGEIKAEEPQIILSKMISIKSGE